MALEDVERLEQRLVDEGVTVDDNILRGKRLRGLYAAGDVPPTILVNSGLTRRARYCVLAEEAGHHYRSFGPATDEHDAIQRRNELSGRRWAYQRLVPLDQLICAWQHGHRARWSMASFFGVTEQFFADALEWYHSKHGVQKSYPGWVIQFDPYFTIYRIRSYR